MKNSHHLLRCDRRVSRTGIALAVATLLILQGIVRGAPGDVDLSFDPGSGVNGKVGSIVVQPDGKVIIAGEFLTVKGAVRYGIARLHSDGSFDGSFDPGTGVVYPDHIEDMALQADNKVLIAGAFSYNRTALARVNADGSLDNSFSCDEVGGDDTTGITNISTIAIQSDGKVLIAGDFASVNGNTRKHIARLNGDGSLDATFDPGAGANAPVLSVALQSDGKVLIGGFFTLVNGTARNRIARLNTDGSLDTDFDLGTGANGAVRIVALQPDGKILVGGSFTSVNGTSRMRIARLNSDGSLDTSFNPGTGADTSVYSLGFQADGKVIVGGLFSSFNGVARDGIARLDANGNLDAGFNPGLGTTYSMAIQSDGKVLIGKLSGISRINGSGSVDTSFDAGSDVGGSVGSIVAQPDGKTLIGGNVRNSIARLNMDGSPDSSFNPGTGPNGPVSVALQPDGKILIGGGFTSVNGTARSRIARLNADGSLDTSFNPGTGPNSHVSVALQLDGKILIGGGFTSVNGTTRNCIARLNANGSLDTGFNPGSGAAGGEFGLPSIRSLVVQADGKVIVGGSFGSFNGTARTNLARLNSNGSLDTDFDAHLSAGYDYVNCVAALSDGKVLVGGSFSSMGGSGILRLNTDGSLDTTFIITNHFAVFSIAIQADGKVLIGTSDYRRIARLNADGCLDTSFNPGTGVVGDYVASVALQADGKVLIGGPFISVNGVARPFVARLHADYLPARLDVAPVGGLPALQLTGEVGQQYVLEYISELGVSNDWTALPSFTLTNSPQSIVDDTAANAPQRFYRARVVTP